MRSRVVYQSTSTPDVGQGLLGARHPAVVGEVLAPAVEAAAVLVDGADDRADPAVAAREQALDDAGLAVVVAEADRAAVLLVAADRSRSFSSRASVSSALSCGAHWNGVCGLGTNPPIETVQRMSFLPETSRPLAITLFAMSAICSTSSSVSVGRPHMKYSFTCRQPLPYAVDDRADQVLLGDHLVDDLADALGAALGGEGQAGAAAVAGQLVGQVDVEGVHPGRRQRQADLVLLVPVGEALGDVADLGVVGAGQRQQADLLEAGGLQALLDHLADAGDATARAPGG